MNTAPSFLDARTMLSRTADHLYWMSRYTERAENTARMLDVNWQMSLLPQPEEIAVRSWRAMLEISELTRAFHAGRDHLDANAVLEFMVTDRRNPSSIASCLHAARENARAVRGSLTTEVWETQNTTWLELQRLLDERQYKEDPSQFFEWVKFRSHLSRGVTVGTMLRDEALHFMRIGTFLERADNTARILDVKFHEVPHVEGPRPTGQFQQQIQFLGTAPENGRHGDPQRDFYHWTALLRSVSAFEIYRKVYRDVVTPERVAELLMLRADMPRSLAASMEELCLNLEQVATPRSAETLRLAGRLRADLQFTRVEDILSRGLHGVLTEFLARVNQLGDRISREFLLPLAA